MLAKAVKKWKEKMPKEKPLSPRETADYVSKISKNVKINPDGVRQVTNELYSNLLNGEYKLSTWKHHHLHPKVANEFAINWIFLCDSLNFSFWPDPGQEYAVTYKNKEYTGYWALCAIINRALDQGIPMEKAAYYSDLSLDQVRRIFKANKPGKPNEPMEIPMLEERARVMKENGEILCKKFSGNFVTVMVKAKHSAASLLKLVLENFPSFRDETKYHGEPIAFYKRAQILIADIYACFENQGLGQFNDIDVLTMFPDYRVPQALHYYDVLIYKEELLRKLRQGVVLRYGDPDEVEIRAVTIQAVELISTGLKEMIEENQVDVHIAPNPVVIDFYLWDLRRAKADAIDAKMGHHKTRCIFY